MNAPLRPSPARPPVERQRVRSAGLDWHVERAGRGPTLLLLHGTGAAARSWAGLSPLLCAAGFEVLAPDLPGHGGTTALSRPRCSLPGMAEALRGLLQTLDRAPVAAIGHSAGAALCARLALDGAPGLERMVWIGGALLPFSGLTGLVAPVLARLLARAPLLPQLAAWGAGDGAAVERLIDTTGSVLDAGGIAAYRDLLRQPAHVSGALAMMAGWDLAPMRRELPRLALPVLMLHGQRDRAVPAAQAAAVARLLPQGTLLPLDGLGHLAHEEAPARVAALIEGWWPRAARRQH